MWSRKAKFDIFENKLQIVPESGFKILRCLATFESKEELPFYECNFDYNFISENKVSIEIPDAPENELKILFMSENGLNSGSLQLLRNIVSACIRRNIFSDRLLKEYGILTSCGIQKRYLKATAKREAVNLKKEYLLIVVPKNRKNVVINSISSYGNSISDGINAQSREEESREDNDNARVTRFNDFFAAYPKQRNLVAAEREYCLLLFNDQDLTEQELIDAAKNYAEAVHILGREERYIKNPERFLKDGTYVDYLEKNYVKPISQGKKNGNKFNQFEQNNYDFDELEKELLSNATD